MTMKKKLLTTLSVVLILGMAVLGVLAYMTATASNDNYMTVGNVDIEQDENGFQNGTPLDPGVTVDKKVTVTNVGKSDAYVRTWFAFEMPMDGVITPNWNAGVDPEELGVQTIEGTKYMIYVAEYGKMAKDDAVTSLLSVTMEPSATNDDVAKYGDNYDVLVFSQAMQVAGFENNEAAAWAAEFGEATLANHPWPAKVDTADELTTALQAGGPVQLTDDVVVGEEIIVANNIETKLDLNGNNIVQAEADQNKVAFDIREGGKVTVTDTDGSGVIENVPGAGDIFDVRGELIIESGVVKNTSNYGNPVQMYGAASFEFKGGEIINTAAGTNSAIDSSTTPAGKIIISGGKIQANGIGITAAHTPVYIKGGEIIANGVVDQFGQNGYALWTRNATIEPAAGKTVNIEASNGIIKTYGSSSEIGHTNVIKGGTFNAAIKVASNGVHMRNLDIYGGAFNVDPTEWLAENYEAVKSGTTWTVQAK